MAEKIYIDLMRDGWTHRLQLSIGAEDESGSGDGYRLWGPKFNGSGTLVHRHELDERDVREIRAYLDRFDAGERAGVFVPGFQPAAPVGEAYVQLGGQT